MPASSSSSSSSSDSDNKEAPSPTEEKVVQSPPKKVKQETRPETKPDHFLAKKSSFKFYSSDNCNYAVLPESTLFEYPNIVTAPIAPKLPRSGSCSNQGRSSKVM